MRVACWLLATAALLPAQSVKLPQYQRRVLDNGVVLDLVVKRDVPMITLRAIVRGGAEADPADRAGLTSVTAEMLRRGSEERSATEFSEQLDFIGATFRTSVDRQSTVVSMEFLKKDAARALELFSGALISPSFPEEEIEKAISQDVDEVHALKDSPSQANSAYFRSFFFPKGHPYSRLASGDEDSLQKITRGEVESQHQRLYTGRNLTLVAAGDFDAAFGESLAKVFGAMPAGTAYSWVKDVPPLARDAARVLLVDKPDATQTYFRIAQPGVNRVNPDRVPLMIVDTLFGGRFTSMLNEALRVKSGLTYGARSVVEEDRLQGAMQMVSYTRTETTVKAIDMALEVLHGLRETGIDAEQLASAKAYIKGSFPTDQLETNNQLAATIGELELFGLDRSEIDDLFAKIDAVTVEQANEVARKYYGETNLQFCLLGNASAIRDEVRKYGKLVVLPVTEPGFAVPEF